MRMLVIGVGWFLAIILIVLHTVHSIFYSMLLMLGYPIEVKENKPGQMRVDGYSVYCEPTPVDSFSVDLGLPLCLQKVVFEYVDYRGIMQKRKDLMTEINENTQYHIPVNAGDDPFFIKQPYKINGLVIDKHINGVVVRREIFTYMYIPRGESMPISFTPVSHIW
jgi:hypothetical protein